jgi:signal transduction histidine kinase
MNAEALPPAQTARRVDPTPADDTDRLTFSRYLLCLRAGWLVIVTISILLLAASLPIYYNQLRSLSALAPDTRDAAIQTGLAELGIPGNVYAVYALILIGISVVCWMGTGFLIAWRKRFDRTALYFSLTLITFGATWPNTLSFLAGEYSWLRIPTDAVSIYGFASFCLLFFLFPNGRFVPLWTRYVAIVMLVELTLHERMPGTAFDVDTWPLPLNLIPFTFPLFMLYAQIHRYRKVSTSTEKQQTKLVMFALVVAIVVFVSLGFAEGVYAFSQPGLPAAVFAFASTFGYYAAMLTVPIAIGIAILRNGLWDVDPIINRTLVYTALTVSVVGIYVIVVGWLGVLFQAGNNLAYSLLATGLVAVLFQPLRERLQKVINRIMYGERDEPYAVISRLGQRLEDTMVPGTVLSTIVVTISEALKLPYVAIEVDHGSGSVVAASAGQPVSGVESMALYYQHMEVGRLFVAPRAQGEHFSAADRDLLEDLARQSGVAIHAVRLAADLQSAREKLVEARENERRRLRRDLHDGLGSQLAALNMQMGALKGSIPDDPATDLQISEIRLELRAAIASIRQIAHDLRPPVLDEFGLLAAICARARQYSGNELLVQVDLPDVLPPLSAATEVAIYRIVEEALTNASRHSSASMCSVRLRTNDGVEVVIEDNGSGISPDQSNGIGLLSMRERAEELGGSCDLETVAGKGLTVTVRLPGAGE